MTDHGWYSKKQMEARGVSQHMLVSSSEEVMCTLVTGTGRMPQGFDDFIYVGEIAQLIRYGWHSKKQKKESGEISWALFDTGEYVSTTCRTVTEERPTDFDDYECVGKVCLGFYNGKPHGRDIWHGFISKEEAKSGTIDLYLADTGKLVVCSSMSKFQKDVNRFDDMEYVGEVFVW